MDSLDKQKAEQAIVPPPQYIRDMIEKVEEPIAPGDSRDKMMIEFAQSDVWKLLKKHITARLAVLANDLNSRVASAPMEEIGYRFLATDLVNRFAQGLVGYVENPLKIKRADHESTANE